MPSIKTSPEEIVKKSILVFRENGYYRTTMNDLANATGLTKGAFYHHFKNKEEVMRMSLKATSMWFEKKIFSIAYNEELTNKEKLVTMGDILFTAFTKNKGGCFFANTILETAYVEDTFIKEIDTFFSLFEKALENIFTEKYKNEKLKNVVVQVISEIEGTIILMQLKKNPTLLRNTLNRVVELI